MPKNGQNNIEFVPRKTKAKGIGASAAAGRKRWKLTNQGREEERKGDRFTWVEVNRAARASFKKSRQQEKMSCACSNRILQPLRTKRLIASSSSR